MKRSNITIEFYAKNCDLIVLSLFKRNKTTEVMHFINKSISICQDTDVDVHSDLNLLTHCMKFMFFY